MKIQVQSLMSHEGRVLEEERKNHWVACRNERVNIKLGLVSPVDVEGVSVMVLADQGLSVRTYWLQEVLAYTKKPVYDGVTHQALPAGDRSSAPDLLSQAPVCNLQAGQSQELWVQVLVGEEVQLGTYGFRISVMDQDGLELGRQDLEVEVLDLSLPDLGRDPLDYSLELWQNPYAVAEYYGVQPFSKEHLIILKPHLLKYREMGGRALTATVTEEAWGGQTYGQGEIKFPSMVSWSCGKDGQITYDYSDFDAWVNLGLELGFQDKLICFSVMPWGDRVGLRQTDGSVEWITYEVGSPKFYSLWLDFLQDFWDHIQAQGWQDLIYLGVDERGFNQHLFELLDRFEEATGQAFRLEVALDAIEREYVHALDLDSLSVGIKAIEGQEAIFKDLVAERRARGLETMVYSCTGHVPGNFTLSQPAETYWSVLFGYDRGAQGFLRWAYDSWVADPLRDTSHTAFEAGDCYLVYPSATPGGPPQSSVCLEMIRMALQDIAKIELVRDRHPDLLTHLRERLVNDYDVEGDYLLTSQSRQKIVERMESIQDQINTCLIDE